MGKKNQAKIDFLKQYESAKKSILALRMQLKALKIDEYSLRGISYEGGDMPKVHNPSDLSDMLMRFRDREGKIKKQIAEAIECQSAILDVINLQEDATEQMVLTCKYVRSLAWKEIAAEIGLNSESRPREIHGEALEKLHWTPPENITENKDGI